MRRPWPALGCSATGEKCNGIINNKFGILEGRITFFKVLLGTRKIFFFSTSTDSLDTRSCKVSAALAGSGTAAKWRVVLNFKQPLNVTGSCRVTFCVGWVTGGLVVFQKNALLYLQQFAASSPPPPLKVTNPMPCNASSHSRSV